MVLRQGLVLAAVGVALGLAGALAVTRVLRALLFGVSPTDPLTFAAVTAVLVVCAVAASYVPARRATSVDPATALRNE
jgi:ABC-type antimicrobial peptide transport system permease subunit